MKYRSGGGHLTRWRGTGEEGLGRDSLKSSYVGNGPRKRSSEGDWQGESLRPGFQHRFAEAEGNNDVKKEQVITNVRVGENSYKNFIY